MVYQTTRSTDIPVDWRNGGVPPRSPGINDAAQQPDVNAVSTGNYGLLSAELCRVTGDMKYCDRAYENAQWIDRHMVDPTDNLLWDHLNGTSCALADYKFTCESLVELQHLR